MTKLLLVLGTANATGCAIALLVYPGRPMPWYVAGAGLLGLAALAEGVRRK